MSKQKKPEPTPAPSLLPEATPGWFGSLRTELGVIQNHVGNVLRAELGIIQKYVGARFENLEQALANRTGQGPPGPPGPPGLSPPSEVLLRLEQYVSQAEAVATNLNTTLNMAQTLANRTGHLGAEVRNLADQVQSTTQALRSEVTRLGAVFSSQEDSAAKAIEATSGQHVRVGFWGLLAAMRRPEVQAGMGRLIELAAHLGAGAAPKALPPKEP